MIVEKTFTALRPPPVTQVWEKGPEAKDPSLLTKGNPSPSPFWKAWSAWSPAWSAS